MTFPRCVRLAGLEVGEDLDLARRGRRRIERVPDPFLCEAAGEFDAHHALAHGEDLAVVGQDGTLNRERVVRRGGADAFHLVRGDGHPDARAAEEDGPVGPAVADHLAGRDAHVGVGPGEVVRGVGPVDADVDHLADAGVVAEIRQDLVLVINAGFVRADNEPQPHGVSFRRHYLAPAGAAPAVVVVKCGPITANTMARDVAPGSAVPRLFSASGRARPFRGNRSAVASAAEAASRAASCQACPGSLPPATARLNVEANGSSASTMVLSPISALPSWTMRSANAVTPAARTPAPGAAEFPTVSPKARRPAPHRTPEVP